MKCVVCGNEINNDSVYCEYCGSKVESEPQSIIHESESNDDGNKKKSKTSIFITIGAVAIAAFIILLIMVTVIIPFIGNKMEVAEVDKVVDQYNSGAITENEAYGMINEIMMKTDNEDVYEQIAIARDEISDLSYSKYSFEVAEECFESGEYEDAINMYSQVIESDKNYDDAQDKIKQSTKLYPR